MNATKQFLWQDPLDVHIQQSVCMFLKHYQEANRSGSLGLIAAMLGQTDPWCDPIETSEFGPP